MVLAGRVCGCQWPFGGASCGREGPGLRRLRLKHRLPTTFLSSQAASGPRARYWAAAQALTPNRLSFFPGGEWAAVALQVRSSSTDSQPHTRCLPLFLPPCRSMGCRRASCTPPTLRATRPWVCPPTQTPATSGCASSPPSGCCPLGPRRTSGRWATRWGWGGWLAGGEGGCCWWGDSEGGRPGGAACVGGGCLLGRPGGAAGGGRPLLGRLRGWTIRWGGLRGGGGLLGRPGGGAGWGEAPAGARVGDQVGRPAGGRLPAGEGVECSMGGWRQGLGVAIPLLLLVCRVPAAHAQRSTLTAWGAGTLPPLSTQVGGGAWGWGCQHGSR